MCPLIATDHSLAPLTANLLFGRSAWYGWLGSLVFPPPLLEVVVEKANLFLLLVVPVYVR
jgi:hypothetical protein